MSSGGFPAQMAALGTLFDELTLVITRSEPLPGAMPLPPHAKVVPLRGPVGYDWRRKVSVIGNLRYYLTAIARQLREADVVHSPLPGDIPFLAMLVAAALRKRLFAMYNGSWVANSQTSFMNRVTRGCMRMLARGNNVMVAVGPLGMTTVPAHRMQWVFVTAISQDEVTRIAPQVDRTPGAPLQLGYVGRLSPEKGLPFLVEAMGALKRDPSLTGRVPHLTLMGDGPQRAELVAQARSVGCEDIIRFAGQLERVQLVRQLLETDVCVLPSLTEGFAKARLDAMLCGVPVITSAVGFGREAVGPEGERGWVVPPGDVPALVEAVRRLVVEPRDWPALRQRCRKYVEEQTLEAWAGRFAEISARQWNLSIVDGRLHNGAS